MHAMLGREALRYNVEVVPHWVEGMPSNVNAVCVVWEKGQKLCLTEPSTVDRQTRVAAFREIMRQVGCEGGVGLKGRGMGST